MGYWKHVPQSGLSLAKRKYAIRQSLEEEAGYKCMACGEFEERRSRPLEVAHIIPIKKFKTYWDSLKSGNLILLCPLCHGAFDGRKTAHGREIVDAEERKTKVQEAIRRRMKE